MTRPHSNPDNDFYKWRKALGWTIAKAARALERNYRTIQRYERGEVIPPAHIVAACSFFALQQMDPARVEQRLAKFRKAHKLRGFI